MTYEMLPLGKTFNELVLEYYADFGDHREQRLGQWICNKYLHTLGPMMTWRELFYAKTPDDAYEAYHHTKPTKAGP
jgi:hypothetical protein